MSLVKCEFCRARVRAAQMGLHLKRCVYARRVKKHEQAMANEPVITVKKRGRPKKEKVVE